MNDTEPASYGTQLMDTRHLLPDDLEAAFNINEEYLSASRSEFFHLYRENEDVFVGVFDEKTLRRFGGAGGDFHHGERAPTTMRHTPALRPTVG